MVISKGQSQIFEYAGFTGKSDIRVLGRYRLTTLTAGTIQLKFVSAERCLFCIGYFYSAVVNSVHSIDQKKRHSLIILAENTWIEVFSLESRIPPLSRVRAPVGLC